MNTRLYTFASGLRLVHQDVPSVRSVGISVLTAAGSNNETAENNGISHFIEHMFFKGTQKRSAFEIVEYVDSLGAQINAFTSKQSTCFYTLGIDRQAEKCAEVLSDLLFYSTFDPEETEREKGVVLEEISMSNDDNDDLCLDLLAEAYFKGSPLARTILGPRENVKKFKREQLLDYIARNYCAENTVISIVGNIRFEDARQLVERYFEGNFTSNPTRKWQDRHHETTPRFVKKIKDIEQSNLALAMPAYPFSHKDDMALMLVNNVVGGGMSSRLFQQIREKMGLAYNVYSYPSSYINNGTMAVYIGTNPDSVVKALGAARDLLREVGEKGLDRKEFERGKQQLLGAYVLGQESTSTMMRVLAKYALYSGELFDIDRKIEAIEAVTYEQACRVAGEVFDLSKASVSYVGKEVKEDLLDVLQG